MKQLANISAIGLAWLALCFAAPALADSLELADGSVLEGDFIGSSNDIIMFKVGDDIQAYPEKDVVGIFMSAGVKTREAQATSVADSVPAGTAMVIRMTDSIDSGKHKVGHRFRGQLEAALAVDGNIVVPRGTFIYGRITDASASGRATGSASLAIEFTDIMMDDQLFPIATTGLSAQGESQAKNTASRTARAAAVGLMLGRSSGAKTGAAVGAGASILTGGSSLSVPAGTMLDTELRVPFQLSN
jgi:hypothetical protein